MSITKNAEIVASMEARLVETGMFEKDSAGVLWLKFDEIRLRMRDGYLELSYVFQGAEAMVLREPLPEQLSIKNLEGRTPMRIL